MEGEEKDEEEKDEEEELLLKIRFVIVVKRTKHYSIIKKIFKVIFCRNVYYHTILYSVFIIDLETTSSCTCKERSLKRVCSPPSWIRTRV